MIDRINLDPDDMDALLDDIEEFYNIRLSGGEVVDTAGALEELIVKKAAPRRVELGGAVIDVFNRLRTALLQIPGIRANVRRPDKSWKISAATPLAIVLKGQDRHRVWHILRQGMGMQLPRMRLSGVQFVIILILLFSPMIALGLTQYVLNYDNTIEWTILTASVFPALAAVTMSRRVAKSLPPDCETMADLAAYLVILNFKMLKAGGALDVEPFDQVRRLICEHSDCRPVDIERTTILEG